MDILKDKDMILYHKIKSLKAKVGQDSTAPSNWVVTILAFCALLFYVFYVLDTLLVDYIKNATFVFFMGAGLSFWLMAVLTYRVLPIDIPVIQLPSNSLMILSKILLMYAGYDVLTSYFMLAKDSYSLIWLMYAWSVFIMGVSFWAYQIKFDQYTGLLLVGFHTYFAIFYAPLLGRAWVFSNWLVISGLLFLCFYKALSWGGRTCRYDGIVYAPLTVLVFGFIALAEWTLMSISGIESAEVFRPLLQLFLLNLLLTLTLCWFFNCRYKIKRLQSTCMILTAVALSWLLTPMMVLSIILMVFGFEYFDRIVLYTGVVFFPFSIIHYYYSLNTPLIEKSLYMMLAGLLFLLFRAFLYYREKLGV
jgi:hypothetical protein